MMEILAPVRHHDEQTLLYAVERALGDGGPTKTHIRNMLHRLVDGKSSAASPIAALQVLVTAATLTPFRQILISQFCDELPLVRQSVILVRVGIETGSATLPD